MKYTQYTVDAFTKKIFAGNPAAVVVLEAFLHTEVMQAWAEENNLSETAFLVKTANAYHIRWFSPLSEIDFCGHASLASAYVLNRFYAAGAEIQLYCDAIGQYQIKLAQDGLISMRFPNLKPRAVTTIPDKLLSGLSIVPDEVLHNQQAYFAVYGSKQQVLDVQIKAEDLKLKTIGTFGCGGDGTR